MEVAAGESCTKVITLFIHKLRDQKKAFAAEIRYSDIGTCKALLQEQLDNFNRFCYHFDDGWLDEQKKDYERSSLTAMKTFRSLFCNRAEFESPRAAKEFLDRHRNAVATALDTFVAWSRELFAKYTTVDGAAVQRFEADTATELNEQLSPHVSEKHKFEQPELCHLVEIVQIGAPSSRILRYVSLADLPGELAPCSHS